MGIFMSMQYLKVEWLHDFQDEPVLIFGELRADIQSGELEEIRKIEIFKDGTMGYACLEEEYLSLVSESHWPVKEEITQDPQFKVHIITQQEFNLLWQEALAKHKYPT